MKDYVIKDIKKDNKNTKIYFFNNLFMLTPPM